MEEYKGVFNPSNTPKSSSKKINSLVKKNYESDFNELKKNTSSAVNSDTGEITFNDKDDEEDDFLYYATRKKSIVEKICSCFSSAVAQDDLLEPEKAKVCGMFGQKSYLEVIEDLQNKSKFKNIKNRGFISVIVKSGDDLRQE